MITALATALLCQAHMNVLSPSEIHEGWKLLFNGHSTAGWHNFKAHGVRAGWQVKDDVLTCADPSNAGDIVTDEKFEWFDLVIDFNLTPGGNSGVMFHVADDGEATWHSGPEVQLYDHPIQEGVETSGFLYQLYKPAKGVDAAKPAGEWNHMRIYVSPTKCFTELNGVKYYEYVLNSEDFKQRVAKSKFAQYAHFSGFKKGSIAIQGDHGIVSFRNIKIRPLHPAHR